jgi:hypothetical protein
MMAERNVQFQVNQDEIQVNNDGNNDNDGNGNQDALILPQNVQAPQVVVPVNAPRVPQTTLAFKVEQSKIP